MQPVTHNRSCRRIRLRALAKFILLAAPLLGWTTVAPKGATENQAMTDGAAGTVWLKQVAAGDTVIVTNHIGAIRCTAAASSQLELRSVPRDGSREPVALEAETDEASGALQLRLGGSDSGRVSATGDSDNRIVDLEVLVPTGIILKLFSAGGDIRADTLSATVEAHSSSGEVTLRRVDGPISASTDSGNIELVLGCRVAPQRQSLSSDGGDIELRIPADADLTLQLTTSGPIRTDFSTTINHSTHGRPVKQGRVVLGDGGIPLAVNNRSGAIVLARDDAQCRPPGITGGSEAALQDPAGDEIMTSGDPAHRLEIVSEQVPLRLRFIPDLEDVEVVRSDSPVTVGYDRAAGSLRIKAADEIPEHPLELHIPARWQVEIDGGAGSILCVVDRHGPRAPLAITTTTGEVTALVEHGVSMDITVNTTARVTTDYTILVDHRPDGMPGTRGRIRFGGEAAPIRLDSIRGDIFVLRTTQPTGRTR